MRDFKRMQSDPPEGVNGAPCDNDIMKWHAVIFGCAAPGLLPAKTSMPSNSATNRATRRTSTLTPARAHPGRTTLRGRTVHSS